ncbi:hypothetical protein CK203_107724 [Vitis vinifera]|uniref:Uncharacterized protein n=1 Tax=Vitis vinifera TaxID=29760 RepID=A0A438CIP5_VITVI|nr:hypothetical protein CK203_107724 [Vitis vinifera]
MDSPSWTRVRGSHGFDSGGYNRPRPKDRWVAAPPQDSAQYDSAAPPPPPLSQLVPHPAPLEQKIRQMRVLDGAISWNDFDGAPVANLPSHFRMPEIKRRAVLEDCGPSLPLLTQKEKKPLEDRDLEMWVLSVQQDRDLPGAIRHLGRLQEPITHSVIETSYLNPQRPSSTDCYSLCIEADTIVLSARYALDLAFQKLMEGSLMTQLAPRPVPQPVPPQFKMDLHYAYHQSPRHDTDCCSTLRHAMQDLIDQGLVNLGQPSLTTNLYQLTLRM